MTLRKKRPLPGLFDHDHRLEQISAQGDPLEKLNEIIDWEMFRPLLDRACAKEQKAPGGRPHYDYVLMFKVLVIQHLYKLSDAQMQYQLIDRLSFQRFLGLTLADAVPDEKTIWLFRDRLSDQGVIQELFDTFKVHLAHAGLLAKEGVIVDATLIAAPIQRNTRDENKKIKNDTVPEDWEKQPHKRRQKDTDARWTRKHGKSYYGYKGHTKIKRTSKLIDSFELTSANTDDRDVLGTLLDQDEGGVEIYGDKGYAGENAKNIVRKHKGKYRILKSGHRHKELTPQQKAVNRKRSRVRSRVEHIYGAMKMQLGGTAVRSIGEIRAAFSFGMTCLLYNMTRYDFLVRSG